MTKTFTASLLALSIAITSISAVPAAADNKDLGRILAGAATLFILSQALENNSKKKATPKVTQHKPAKKYYPPRRFPPKQVKPSKQHFRLPAECAFPVRTRHGGTRKVFGKHCLEENARIPRLLPRVCEEEIRIRYGRTASVYDASCLMDRGYRVEGRRR